MAATPEEIEPHLPALKASARPVCGKHIVWQDGVPIPVYTQPITTPNLNKLVLASAQVEYKPKDDSDPERPGVTKIEVAVERAMDRMAWGCQDTLEWFFDRVIGKPKQTVESVTMALTYEEFVSRLPAATQDELEDAGIVDVVANEYDDLEGV
jgi:hypothetical protein